jgi:ATP-binding cassette subfamily B protein RaxB
MQSVKIFTREAERSAVWMNRYAEVVKAEASTGLLRQTFHVANEVIFGLDNVLIIYLGAQAHLPAA